MPHGVSLDSEQLFFSRVHLHGGPAPVRRCLPELIKMVSDGKISPGTVFDLNLPLDQRATVQWTSALSRRFCAQTERTKENDDEDGENIAFECARDDNEFGARPK